MMWSTKSYVAWQLYLQDPVNVVGLFFFVIDSRTDSEFEVTSPRIGAVEYSVSF